MKWCIIFIVSLAQTWEISCEFSRVSVYAYSVAHIVRMPLPLPLHHYCHFEAIKIECTTKTHVIDMKKRRKQFREIDMWTKHRKFKRRSILFGCSIFMEKITLMPIGRPTRTHFFILSFSFFLSLSLSLSFCSFWSPSIRHFWLTFWNNNSWISSLIIILFDLLNWIWSLNLFPQIYNRSNFKLPFLTNSSSCRSTQSIIRRTAFLLFIFFAYATVSLQ